MKIKYCTLFLLLIMGVKARAQLVADTCNVAVIARYIQGANELRWAPGQKTILFQSFKQGYTVERSDSGRNQFALLATVKPYTGDEWNKLIANEKDEQLRTALSICYGFMNSVGSTASSSLGLDKGIAKLRETRSNEEMLYGLFVINSMKYQSVALASGLAYIDKNVVAGKTYTYRIRPLVKSNVYAIEPGMVDVVSAEATHNYKTKVTVFAGDTKLSFVWGEMPEVSGFWVYRKAEGEKQFKRITTTPIYASTPEGYEGVTNNTFQDDSLINYKMYQYRFYGYTAFGDSVLFAEATGMPKDLTPPTPPIVKAKHIAPKKVEVTWELKPPADLLGFIVARSDKDTGDFHILHKQLLPSATRSFDDSTFNKETSNYYIVYTLDTAGNISASYPAYVALIDSTPPAKPVIKDALIDSNGIVHIRVIPGKEKDLKGYRLYRANDSSHEVSALQEHFLQDKSDTAKLQTTFVDTISLGTLTPKIYYRVKALDFNYNQSAFSDWVVLKRPDTIPPVTPVFVNVVTSEKNIQLQFVGNGSPDADSLFLYRKLNTDDAWKPYQSFTAQAASYVDTSVKTGQTYYYTLRAKDESGLLSGYAAPVLGKPYNTGLLPLAENVIIKNTNGKIALSWSYSLTDKNILFQIYAIDKNGQLTVLLKTKEHSCIVSPRDATTLAVRAVSDDGKKSMLKKISVLKQ